MMQFNCVFCGEQVLADSEIKDETAKAICDSCFAKGGRLPGNVWEVSFDSEGRPRQSKKQRFLTSEIHYKIVIVICIVFFLLVPIAYLFVNPGLSIVIFLLYCTIFFLGKRDYR